MSDKKIRNRHDSAFKERAVNEAIRSGNITQTAKSLGISYSLLQSWKKQAEYASVKGKGLQAAIEEKAELDRLRKENIYLKEEVEILKKAAVYFATDRLKKSTPGSRN